MPAAAFAETAAGVEIAILQPKYLNVVLDPTKGTPLVSEPVIVPVSVAWEGGTTFSDFLQQTRGKADGTQLIPVLDHPLQPSLG